MARKQSGKGRPPGRHGTGQQLTDVLWAEMRRRGRFTMADLPERHGTAKTYVCRLVRAGILAVEDRIPGKRGFLTGLVNVYRVVEDRDPGVLAPRFTRDGQLVTSPTASDRLWAAMKPLPSWTIDELAAIALVPRTTAARYVSALSAAGYLDELAPGGGYHRVGRWALRRTRNTGPRPPMVARDHSVWDPNEQRTVLESPRAGASAEPVAA